MLKSDSIKELSAALAKAQAKLKNPHFDSTNPHFKSKFASLAAVRNEVIPAFASEGLSITQWPVAEGNYAGCITHISHASGEWMEERFLIPIDKANAHGYASAVTYAKRISMQAVAGVVGDEDDDGNAAVGDNVAGKNLNALTEMKQDAFEALPEDEKTFLRGLAADVTALVQEGRTSEAFGMIEHKHLDTEEKLALWHLLDSKTRAAIKAAQKEHDMQRMAEERAAAKAKQPAARVQ